MEQQTLPIIFSADETSRWSSEHAGIWSLRGADFDSVPTMSILTTLWDHPRWLEAYHLYDAQGSELFENICELPEYYLTRTENSILEVQAKNIIAAAPVEVHRRARRRLQQKNRALAYRTDAPARQLSVRAHRCQHRRSARLRKRRCAVISRKSSSTASTRATKKASPPSTRICRRCSCFSAALSATSTRPSSRVSSAPSRAGMGPTITCSWAPTGSKTKLFWSPPTTTAAASQRHLF